MAKRITLSNIGGGELELLVSRELKKICENIADPAVRTEAVRKLSIQISVKPDKKGQVADISYAVKRTLAAVDANKSSAYIAMEPGTTEIALFGMDLRQNELFPEKKEPPVTEIKPVSPPIANAAKLEDGKSRGAGTGSN